MPTRHVLEAVLWILKTGAQWHMLPQSHPNYKTVHRRFETWCCNEILRRVYPVPEKAAAIRKTHL
jgi:transposase